MTGELELGRGSVQPADRRLKGLMLLRPYLVKSHEALSVALGSSFEGVHRQLTFAAGFLLGVGLVAAGTLVLMQWMAVAVPLIGYAALAVGIIVGKVLSSTSIGGRALVSPELLALDRTRTGMAREYAAIAARERELRDAGVPRGEIEQRLGPERDAMNQRFRAALQQLAADAGVVMPPDPNESRGTRLLDAEQYADFKVEIIRSAGVDGDVPR